MDTSEIGWVCFVVISRTRFSVPSCMKSSQNHDQSLPLHHSPCVSMIACVAVNVGVGPPTCVHVFDISPKARGGQRPG